MLINTNKNEVIEIKFKKKKFFKHLETWPHLYVGS